jgi:uncharacterized protein (DUF58 family)
MPLVWWFLVFLLLLLLLFLVVLGFELRAWSLPGRQVNCLPRLALNRDPPDGFES